jgi:glycosyltransferase involved in cell wall biosynthesis
MLDKIPRAVRIERIDPCIRPSYRFFPRIDGGLPYVLAARERALRVLRANPPSAVMASGPPFSTFVVAGSVARSWSVPLLLDYRDEWTECPFGFVNSGRLDRICERRCLQIADRVVFTTCSQLEHQLSAFSELERGKCVVVPNGWDPDEFVLGSETIQGPVLSKGTILLSFVGSIGNHTMPARFLSALQSILDDTPAIRERLKLRFIGDKCPEALEQISSFGYPALVEVMGVVTHDRACGLMRQSSALLIFNEPPLARYLPGKLYDYLAARRPVLVFGDTGETAALVRRLRAGVVVPLNDREALRKAIVEIGKGESQFLSDAEREQWLEEHTRRRLSRRMIGELERLQAS